MPKEAKAEKLKSAGPERPPVYVLTADRDLADQLTRLLASAPHKIARFESSDAFLDAYESGRSGLALVDADLPGTPNGLDLVERLRHESPELILLVTAAAGDVPSAVRALRAGALDLFERPLVEAVVRHRVLDALSAID